jgi:hypothetical protein
MFRGWLLHLGHALLSALVLLIALGVGSPIARAAGPLLIDDFNSNAIDSNKWSQVHIGSGPTLAATNQRLQITR